MKSKCFNALAQYQLLDSPKHSKWPVVPTESTTKPKWAGFAFDEGAAAAAVAVRHSLKLRSVHGCIKKGMFTSHVQIENSLLDSYATDNITAEADRAVQRFFKPTNIFPIQYVDAKWMKTLLCEQVYDEYVSHEKVCGRLIILWRT